MNDQILHHSRTLTDNFQFSQGSLQAFVDCPRLFQLRYIERLSWPAHEVEPSIENEHYMELGSAFHQMVQQFYIGVDPQRLGSMAIRDSLLNQWWENFIQHKPNLGATVHYVEFSLSIPIDRYRLVAKYDLLFCKKPSMGMNFENAPASAGNIDTEGINWIIFDWKTSRTLPERQWLAVKLQTRVYPYLVVKTGLHNNTIEPDNIEMVYWFSNYPSMPVHFNYSQENYDQDEAYILGLIDEIKMIGIKEAPKTENQKRCRFCVYRSLCDRGIKAGSLTEFHQDEPFQDPSIDSILEIDFDQIAEIAF